MMNSKLPARNRLLLALSFIIWNLMTVRCLPEDGITYEDIQKLKANCSGRDSCQTPRIYDTLKEFNCNCGMFCTQYNTCCIDSPFRLASPTVSEYRMQCTKLYRSRDHYYMIDSCDPSWWGDDTIKQLCLSNGEELNDPTLLIPVMNSATGITYKNYFCSVCNGNNENQPLVYWEAEVSSFVKAIPNSPLELLNFDKINRVWKIHETHIPRNPARNPVNGTASDAPTDSNFDVEFEVRYPLGIWKIVHFCRKTISECPPSWKDDNIKKKCSAYMAIINLEGFYTSSYFPYTSYRNVHCALCNSKTLERMHCSAIDPGYEFKPVRSFSFLIDVNASSGNIVGKRKKCNEGSIYDPYFDKCRALKCALPGYSIQKGKCVKT